MARSSDSQTDLDDALALLSFAFRRVVEGPDAMLAKRGFGRVHHRILYFVRRLPSPSVGELQEILGVTKQSLHPPLQELVKKGYVASTRSPASRRTKILTLTKKGAALEDALSGPQRKMFAQAFRSLPKSAESAWRKVMFEIGGRKAIVAR
ncbi:MAG TPA: MarR family transcriptional regulator [Polyangiaceae bacterium]